MGDNNRNGGGKSRKQSHHHRKSWNSVNIASEVTTSEAIKIREAKAKRRRKRGDSDRINRIPFEEMFLFGSHPETDILSLSQCPGCSRRYKTQWLHKYHWQPTSNGDYVCALTKAVVIPHRSPKSDHRSHQRHKSHSSKSGDSGHHHHKTHHHGHSSKSSSATHSSSSKMHFSSHSSGTKSSSSSSSTSKMPVPVAAKSDDPSELMKPPKIPKSSLMAKAKVKMPPTSLSSSHGSSSKSHERASVGSYTLSIPSDDIGQNESVESLLSSNKHSGSVSGSKSIQMIATASTSSKTGGYDGEYEEMKFYGGESGNVQKKIKVEKMDSFGQTYQLSIKSSEPKKEGVTSKNSSKHSHPKPKGYSHEELFGTPPDNFKVPFSVKPATVTSQSVNNNGSLKHKSKSPSSGSSSLDSSPIPRSPTSSNSSSPPSPASASRSVQKTTHIPATSPTLSSLLSPGSGDKNAIKPIGQTILIDPHHMKNTEKRQDDPIAPPKKKKKKKSKDEPRKFLPLKDRLFDPDQHCGVQTDAGVPCTRSLTCKTHSMAARRAVPGRSQAFNELLAEHKKARDAEKASKLIVEISQPEQVQDNSYIQMSQAAATVMNSNKSSPMKVKQKPLLSPDEPASVAAPELLTSGTGTKYGTNPMAMDIGSGLGLNIADNQPVTSLKLASLLQGDSAPSSHDNSSMEINFETLVDKADASTASYTLSLQQSDSVYGTESKTLIYEPEDVSAGNYRVTSSGTAMKPSDVNSSTLGVSDVTLDFSKSLELASVVSGEMHSTLRNEYNMGQSHHLKPTVSTHSTHTQQQSEVNGFQPQQDTPNVHIQDSITAAVQMASGGNDNNSGAYRLSAANVRNAMVNMSQSMEQPYSSSQGSLMYQSTPMHSTLASTSGASYSVSAAPSIHSNHSSLGYHAQPTAYHVPHTGPNMSNSAFSAVPQSSHLEYPTYSTETLPDYHTDSYAASHMYSSMQQQASLVSPYNSYPPTPAQQMYPTASSQPVGYHHNGSVYPKVPNLFPSGNMYPNTYPPHAVHPPSDLSSSLYAVNPTSLFPSEAPVFSLIEDLFREPAAINDSGGHNTGGSTNGSSFNNSTFQRPFHGSTSTLGPPISGPGPPGDLSTLNNAGEQAAGLTLNSRDPVKLDGPNSGIGLPGITAGDASVDGQQPPPSGLLPEGSVKKLLTLHQRMSSQEQNFMSVEDMLAEFVSSDYVRVESSTKTNIEEKAVVEKPKTKTTSRKDHIKKINEKKSTNGFVKIPPSDCMTMKLMDAIRDQNLQSGSSQKFVEETETCLSSLPTLAIDVEMTSDDIVLSKKKSKVENLLNFENVEPTGGKDVSDEIRQVRLKDVLRVLNVRNSSASWSAVRKFCGIGCEPTIVSSRDVIIEPSSMSMTNELEGFVDGIPALEVKQ